MKTTTGAGCALIIFLCLVAGAIAIDAAHNTTAMAFAAIASVAMLILAGESEY